MHLNVSRGKILCENLQMIINNYATEYYQFNSCSRLHLCWDLEAFCRHV